MDSSTKEIILELVDWNDFCHNTTLFKKFSKNTTFIREFQNKVNWNYIRHQQTLSKKFRNEFKDKIL